MADTHTIDFVPTRLNRAPVVFRGMTGREVMLMVISGAGIGFVPGLLGWWGVGMVAMVPTLMAVTTFVAVWYGGFVLRRLRRGRPETWLYRRVQWALAKRGLNSAQLILETATYRTRRDRSRHTGDAL